MARRPSSQRHARGGDQRLRVGHVELAGEGRETLARQRRAVLLRDKIFVGDGNLLLIAAQVEVIQRDFRRERDEHGAAVFQAGGDVRLGGLDVPPRA